MVQVDLKGKMAAPDYPAFNGRFERHFKIDVFDYERYVKFCLFEVSPIESLKTNRLFTRP